MTSSPRPPSIMLGESFPVKTSSLSEPTRFSMPAKVSETIPYSAVPEPSKLIVAVTPSPIPSNEFVSIPSPPSIESVPPSPISESSPEPPINVSFPAPPNKKSFPEPPVIVSSPLPPKRPVPTGSTVSPSDKPDTSIVSDPSSPLTINWLANMKKKSGKLVAVNESSRSPRLKLTASTNGLKTVNVSLATTDWLRTKSGFPTASSWSTIESPPPT